MIGQPAVLRLGAATLSAVVVLLSLLPGVAMEGDTTFTWHVEQVPSLLQNSMHVVLYGVLTVAWLLALPRRPAVAVTVALVAVGAVLEAAQLAIPGRFATFWDALLNAGGVAAGLGVARATALA